MKRLTPLLAFVLIFNIVHSQHHLYLGARAGAGYASDMYKLTGLVFGSDYSPSLDPMQTHSLKSNTNAVGTGLKAELLYGYKIFRIGYQFDYLYFRGISYVDRITPPESGTGRETFSGRSNSQENFIGNSILFEVTAFQKKLFSVSPNVSAGHFVEVNSRGTANTGYFQAGAGLMLGFDVKGMTLYINPDYTLRYSREVYHDATTFKNPYRLIQSALLNFGIRGDLLSIAKKKDK
jgi:hypothetical protein